MPSPAEYEFLAKLVALFSLIVAGVFLAGEQPTRSAWIALTLGGVLVTLIEMYAIYLKIEEE